MTKRKQLEEVEIKEPETKLPEQKRIATVVLIAPSYVVLKVDGFNQVSYDKELLQKNLKIGDAIEA